MELSIKNGLSPVFVLFDVLLLLAIVALFYPAIKRTGRLCRSDVRLGVFLMILFCEFALWGTDWFHYKAILEELLNNPDSRTHLEPIYIFINNTLLRSYLLFRLVIWGGAFYFFSMCIKLLDLREDKCYAIFAMLGLLRFSISRVSIAISLLFFAILLFYKADKYRFPLLCKIFAIILMLASLFFHKSAVAIIVLLFLLSICNRLPILKGRYLYIIIICMMPVMAYVLKDFIQAFMIYDSVSDSDSMQQAVSSGQSYMNRDRALGFGSFVAVVLQNAPLYILGYISYRFLSIKKGRLNPKFTPVLNFSKLYLFLLLAISFFLFDLGVETITLYDRLIYFLLIPEALLLCFFMEKNFMVKWSQRAIYIGLAGTMYQILYTLYLSMVSKQM